MNTSSYVGIPPMRYEIVIECDGAVHDRMQTNCMQAATRELLKPLPKGHEWRVVMFIAGEPSAWRADFNR